MIHHPNHVRPKIDGIKTRGISGEFGIRVSTLTALYFSALRP
jgi:pyruvate dehydrogenase E1 component